MDLSNKLVFVDGVDVTPLGVLEVSPGLVRTRLAFVGQVVKPGWRSAVPHYGVVEVRDRPAVEEARPILFSSLVVDPDKDDDDLALSDYDD